jgi:UDP-N-acetylmuramoyl-tripeptide--D-alanyl-D-alanine ligase
MILTMVLLALLLAVCAVILGNTAATVILGAACLFAPFWVLLANTVNKPIEKGINRYYINDAKKILAGCKNLTVIGVTGSYGKTSVKYILSTLLQAKYNVLITPESYNTPMGVVITVRQHLRATHQVFVCEMGARHVGDIKELCDIAHPHMGIITSVGPQHLETFHSIENVKKTKFELADAMPAGGTLFLNGEDANIREHRVHAKEPIISYGLSDACDSSGKSGIFVQGDFKATHGQVSSCCETAVAAAHDTYSFDCHVENLQMK